MATPLLCPSCGGALDADARACPQCGTTVATRRCDSCLALNLRDDRHCRACGTRLRAEEASARGQKRPCPGCAADLTPRQAGNTPFEECDHCSGVWLGPETLKALSTGAEARAAFRLSDSPPEPIGSGSASSKGGAAAPAIAYRRCPGCRKMMNRTNYALGSGVVVDVCKEDGAWFDADELSRIIAFIEGGGLDRARRREVARLEARASEAKRQAVAMRNGNDVELSFGGGTAHSSSSTFDFLGWLGDMLG